MKRFTRILNSTPDEILPLIDSALRYKKNKTYPDLSTKLLGLVFFNSSLRTRLSFEAAMARAGGQALSVTPGSGTWAFETEFGVKMNSDKPEHIKEAARVISRYVDCIGVRSFASLTSLEKDFNEEILSAFEEFATVPVISLESATEHPCQMIADMVTLREKLINPKGKTFCLRWAPHIKPLPLAVPHSAALAAAFSGMNVTVAAPPGYELHAAYEKRIRELTELSGTNFSKVHSVKEIDESTEVLYVKSWGASELYGDLASQEESFQKHSDWMVTEDELLKKQHLMHCLPVRRNVVISDGVLDSKNSIVIDQAENRLWGQLAVLQEILGEKQ